MAMAHPRSPPGKAFERLIELPTAWTCISGRMGVHLFQGELTVTDMDRMDAAGAAWQAAHPGKRVELTIVLPSDARLTAEQRTRMTRLVRRWEKERVASATVILAEGLRGAMHRSVLTGLMMLAPPPHPAKVFGGIAEAVAYLAPHVQSLNGPTATRAMLLTGVLEQYEAFRART
jgi:hypothetical protein